MRKKYWVGIILAVQLVLMSVSASVWADWVQDGGSLNVNTGNRAYNASFAFSGSTPYITWSENGSAFEQIYVKYWNGSNWVQLGGSLNVNPAHGAEFPSLTIQNSIPYVSWQEDNGSFITQIFVKHWSGSSWVQDGASLNVTSGQPATHPSIASGKNTPFVSWSEKDAAGLWNQVYVKHWNGASWVQNGGSLNINTARPAISPSLVISTWDQEIPYVAWSEYNTSGIPQICVASWNGTSWAQLSGSLNMNSGHYGQNPSLVLWHNSVPYAAWTELTDAPKLGWGQIFTKHWTGASWVQDGGVINLDATQNASYPSLADASITTYVSWSEAGQIYVKHWNGSNWVRDGGSLNVDTGQGGWYPRVAVNGTPYACWMENYQIYVKHYLPPTLSDIQPAHGTSGKSTTVMLVGKRISNAPIIKLVSAGQPDILATNIVVKNTCLLSCSFDLTNAQASFYNVSMEIDGSTVMLNHAFQVLQPVSQPCFWNITDLGSCNTPSIGGFECGLTIGDVNGDNSQELYAATRSNADFSKLAWSGLTWAMNAAPTSGVINNDVISCDLDQDGTKELFAAAQNNHVYQYKGGGYNKSDLGSVTGKLLSLAYGDGNNDGELELYVACDNQHVYEFKNNGTAWVKTDMGITGGAALPLRAIAVGDGDNDNSLTPLKVYAGSEDHTLYEYRITVGNTFTAWAVTPIVTLPGIIYSLVIADQDHDSKNEIYAACGNNKIYQIKKTTSWASTEVATGNGIMYKVIASDGENSGAEKLYAACGDGHVYQAWLDGGIWRQKDLGSSGATSVYALAIGDGKNGNQYAVYALGDNSHVYEFRAQALPSPTPTPTLIVTPTASPTPTPVVTIPPAPDRFFKLYHNQINPKRGERVVIKWSQPETARVTITVYNMVGDKIATVVDQQEFSSGVYNEVFWRGVNQNGNIVGSGIYIVYLKVGNYETYSKAAVVK
jgi:hypothetical protein